MEIWKTIEGYEGIYSVSNLGRVRRDTHPGGRIKNRIRKICIGSKGYFQVILSKSSKERTFQVHTLMAYAFLGPIPMGYTVNHKDGVKLNNTVENLEYLTKLENNRHAWRMGLCK